MIRIIQSQFIEFVFSILHWSFSTASGQLLFLQLLWGNLFLLGQVIDSDKSLFLLNQDQLNVAGRRHVRVDPTVSSVGTSAHLRGTVDLQRRNVLYFYINKSMQGYNSAWDPQLKGGENRVVIQWKRFPIFSPSLGKKIEKC